ncbi:patatin-like phospholipase family protein [Aureibacter tunicatorum]|uniref:NTE family protein n=1 Tax=Aureibacter tunicatorum TaxID=866807 RepID=A0AAE4BRK7_9BACT|nr:patatin-like phospholipase family protein [Aureibacter tunicatorum]MDR6240324.1 NTE family protein [Aureibacter tunicatorum]BDD05795.1 phospholipase [Aureibacter tunicatorum]
MTNILNFFDQENKSLKRLGLALSGGGAKGMAHLGILQFFREENVNFHAVSGTSIGAIVGAFYCKGYTPLETLDFFKNTSFFSFDKFSWGSKGLIDSSKFIDDFKKYFPENNFSELEKPLVVCATDILEGKEAVFNNGKLIEALLSSAAFPGMISPMEWNDKLYADGGILNNLPASHIRHECEYVVGIKLQPIEHMKKSDINSTFDLLARVYELNGLSTELREMDHCDLALVPKHLLFVSTFNVKSEDLERTFELGYEYAREYFSAQQKELDNLKKRSE